MALKKKNPDLDTPEEQEGPAEDNTSELVAEKLSFLFETCRKPSGERYTPREVEEGTGGKVTQSWIWKLSKGKSARPGLGVLKSLSDFFGVEPSFWFNELDESTKAKIRIERGGEYVRAIALRASELSPEAQKMVLDIIGTFEQSGLKSKRKE